MPAHHFIIEPKQGVGPIRFGMKKDDVSHAFTYVYSSFFKSAERKVRADHIEVVGLIVHYDDDARVSYIEVTPPKHSTVTLELWGQELTGASLKKAFDILRARSAVFSKDEYGYDFQELGVSLYIDDLESEDDLVDCFGISP